MKHRRRIILTALAITMTVALAGCARTATDAAAPTMPSQAAALTEPGSIEDQVPAVGTGGRLIPVSSSNAAAAGYDDASSTMTVQFLNGRLYEYYNVPPDLWERFIAAQPHPWSAVGYPELVQGGYPYREVTP